MRCKRTIISFITITFLYAIPELANSSVDEANMKLTPEIISIIKRNQANWDLLKTMQGDIRIESKTDYGDQGISHIIETEKFWFDNYHLRSDVLNTEYIGRTEPLIIKNSGGVQKTMTGREKGMVEIKSNESRLSYLPRAQSAIIVPPEGDEKNFRRMAILLKYQTLSGSRLKEAVLEAAQKGVFPPVKSDTIGEDECFLLEWNFSNGNGVRVWVVPSKGCAIKKKQTLVRNMVYDEYITNLKEYLPGFWWFDSVKEMDSQNRTVEVSVDSLTINETIDPSIFALAGTNIPHGTRIRDKITGMNYIYGEGFRLMGEDVDLALDAMKDSMDKTIKETADSEEKPSPEIQSNSEITPEDPNELEQIVPVPSEKTEGRNPLILILGSGIALAAILVVIIKSIRR